MGLILIQYFLKNISLANLSQFAGFSALMQMQN
jgi:hypothetical protein